MNDAQNGIRTFMIYGIYDGVNVAAFHQWLVDSVDILSYWNHLPLLYCVKTRLDVTALSYKVQPFFGDRFYIVGEVQAHLLNGRLPQAAWHWFAAPAPTYKTESHHSLASLFLPKN